MSQIVPQKTLMLVDLAYNPIFLCLTTDKIVLQILDTEVTIPPDACLLCDMISERSERSIILHKEFIIEYRTIEKWEHWGQ